MEIALVANLKQYTPSCPDGSPDRWLDLDSWETIQSIAIAMEQGGHRVTFLEGDKSLYNNLDAVKSEICFNICRGHFGASGEAQVPAILDLLHIPYTGSTNLTLALAADKPMTKRILIYHGLPTPAFQVFEHENETLDPRLHFPLWVKSNRIGTNPDINPNIGTESLVHDQNQLRTQIRHVIDRYRQPALVEQSIEGRRITAGIVGNLIAPFARDIPGDETAGRIFQGLNILPLLEVDTAAYLTTDSAGNTETNPVSNIVYRCPPLLPEARVEDLRWLAAITFRVMGCLDLACIDFQLDANDNDKPYILNVNPLPGLTPEVSELCLAAKANDWTYDGLINRILDEAIQRHQLKPSNNRPGIIPEIKTMLPVLTTG